MIYRFSVPLPPKSKDRVRVNRKTGAIYKTSVCQKWEASLASMAQQYIHERIIGVPVRIDILIAFSRPLKMLEKWKKDNHSMGRVNGAWKYYPGLVWHIKTPDKDNVEKSVLDALKPFWQDDCLVTCGMPVKCYCEVNGIPRIEVRIEVLPYDEFGFYDNPLDYPEVLVKKLGLWTDPKAPRPLVRENQVDLFDA